MIAASGPSGRPKQVRSLRMSNPSLSNIAILLAISITAVTAAPALADPAYIGQRSANPEHETFADPSGESAGSEVGFVGPARNVGAITGDQEKDTFAYRAITGAPESAALAPEAVQGQTASE